MDKEILIPLTDESIETKGGMDGFQSQVEFWPVEHPIEPPDEDRPVICPIPHSSIINDGQVSEERLSESLRKRREESGRVKREGMMVMCREAPVRAVRKRQHTMLTMPPQNVTIFQMLHHLTSSSPHNQ